MGDRTTIRYYLHKGKYRLAWVPLEKERAQSKNVTRLSQVDKGVLYIQFAPPENFELTRLIFWLEGEC